MCDCVMLSYFIHRWLYRWSLLCTAAIVASELLQSASIGKSLASIMFQYVCIARCDWFGFAVPLVSLEFLLKLRIAGTVCFSNELSSEMDMNSRHYKVWRLNGSKSFEERYISVVTTCRITANGSFKWVSEYTTLIGLKVGGIYNHKGLYFQKRQHAFTALKICWYYPQLWISRYSSGNIVGTSVQSSV